MLLYNNITTISFANNNKPMPCGNPWKLAQKGRRLYQLLVLREDNWLIGLRGKAKFLNRTSPSTKYIVPLFPPKGYDMSYSYIVLRVWYIILPTPERKKQTEAVNKGFTLVADDWGEYRRLQSIAEKTLFPRKDYDISYSFIVLEYDVSYFQNLKQKTNWRSTSG